MAQIQGYDVTILSYQKEDIHIPHIKHNFKITYFQVKHMQNAAV